MFEMLLRSTVHLDEKGSKGEIPFKKKIHELNHRNFPMLPEAGGKSD